MPRIENWALTSSLYDAPELKRLRIDGVVYGHDSYPDGSEITTSWIVGRNGRDLIVSSGKEYQLGVVRPDYEAQYPDAHNRLLAAVSAMEEIQGEQTSINEISR